MSTVKELFPQSSADTVALTYTSLASLGSSSTFVAGAESGAVSNRTNLDLDHILSGNIKVGTSPAANTQIQIWVIFPVSLSSGTVTWPDVFDGTDSAETATSAGVLQGCGRLAFTINVDSTTTDRVYPFTGISIAALNGGFMPTDYGVFVTQNTGAALNASGSSAVYERVQATVA